MKKKPQIPRCSFCEIEEPDLDFVCFVTDEFSAGICDHCAMKIIRVHSAMGSTIFERVVLTYMERASDLVKYDLNDNSDVGYITNDEWELLKDYRKQKDKLS